ncbi:unnamed protein product [Lathyrus sativus]|nr:unnamed protein product [Lathyrus sativus]
MEENNDTVSYTVKVTVTVTITDEDELLPDRETQATLKDNGDVGGNEPVEKDGESSKLDDGGEKETVEKDGETRKLNDVARGVTFTPALLNKEKNRRGRKRKFDSDVSRNTRNKKVICNEGDSSMCHQCQRNDKGRVVRCTKCKRKRFCIPCITNWYTLLLF